MSQTSDCILSNVLSWVLPVQVWLYLLGHYEVAMTTEEQQAKDVSSREQYERAMSEWMAVEAIVRQREAENHVLVKAASESQDGASGGHLVLQHKDSTLSNEVFESIDDAEGAAASDYAPRPSTVTEESSSPSAEESPASRGSVAMANGSGDAAEGPQACNGVHEGDGSSGTEAEMQPGRGNLRSIIVTNASVDQPDLPSPTSNSRHMNLELGLTALAESNGGHYFALLSIKVNDRSKLSIELRNKWRKKFIFKRSLFTEHLSASKESLVLPSSPQSNTSNGGVYSVRTVHILSIALYTDPSICLTLADVKCGFYSLLRCVACVDGVVGQCCVEPAPYRQGRCAV